MLPLLMGADPVYLAAPTIYAVIGPTRRAGVVASA